MMKTLIFLTAALPAMFASSSATALELQTAAASACKSALPVFDGNIRTRPLAMQNEGASNAFVTCAQQVDIDLEGTVAGVRLINVGSVAKEVTCTIVDGYDASAPEYQTKTTNVGAGGGAWVVFNPVTPATTFSTSYQAFSCNLLPGTGISRIAVITGT